MENSNQIKLSKKFPEIPLISASFAKNDPDIIPFSFGYPAPETFPKIDLQRATAKALSTNGDNALQYSGGDGGRHIIEWIKNRVKNYDMDVDKNEIMITTGSGQAIDLITRTLTDPGDTIWIEGPTFFGALRNFRLAEVRMRTFQIDEDGLIVDDVEKALEDIEENGGAFPKFLYVISNYHNPGGVSLSLERRKKLAELARKYNFFILEDDAYVELGFDNQRLPSVYSFCPERVIYLSTFSKVFAPGLRVGWAIGDREVLGKMRMLKSDGNTSVFVQETVYRMLENMDIDSHLNKSKRLYKKRMNVMVTEIEKQLGKYVSFNLPNGGFFIWLKFKGNIDTTELLELSREKYKVNFIAGKQFFPDSIKSNYVRLCFAYCDEQRIVEGINGLSKAYFEITENV